MKNYQALITKILDYGDERMDRTGVGTKALFGTQLKFYLQDGFPATTIKQLMFKTVAAELAGFLEATESAQRMEELGAKIWHANARAWYKSDNTNSRNIHDLGRIYGVQWRKWNNTIDQLGDVVRRITDNPSDRRLIVTAWNPSEQDKMCLPPCHTHFQFFVRQGIYLDCLFYMRSVDVFLGLPFDIASYALLTHIVANQTGLVPGILTASMGDTHIYNNHVDQCELIVSRTPHVPPVLELDRNATIDNFYPNMAKLVGYKHEGRVEAPMAV